MVELDSNKRVAFLKAARAEFSPDRLASPTQFLVQAVGTPLPHGNQQALSSGSIIFLFTNIEGSRQLRKRHLQTMQTELALHYETLAQAIGSH